jgi:hypothetical protein
MISKPYLLLINIIINNFFLGRDNPNSLNIANLRKQEESLHLNVHEPLKNPSSSNMATPIKKEESIYLIKFKEQINNMKSMDYDDKLSSQEPLKANLDFHMKRLLENFSIFIKELNISLDQNPQEFPLKIKGLMDPKPLNHSTLNNYIDAINDFMANTVININNNQKEAFETLRDQMITNFQTISTFLDQKTLALSTDTNNKQTKSQDMGPAENFIAMESVNGKQFYIVLNKMKNQSNQDGLFLDFYEENKQLAPNVWTNKTIFIGSTVVLIVSLFSYKLLNNNPKKNRDNSPIKYTRYTY